MSKIRDAVWAAQLMVDGRVMLISSETTMEICKALVELGRRHCPDCMRSDNHCFTDGIEVTP